MRWTDKLRPIAGSNLFRVYLPATLCFLVINYTNPEILKLAAHHGLLHGSGEKLAANFAEKARFLLGPVKTLAFLLGTAILLTPLAVSSVRRIGGKLTGADVRRTLGSLAVCLGLTATLAPTAFGMYYAQRSTDPFNQGTDQIYRRLLLPGLAHILHLDGVFYIVFFWGVVAVAALTVRWYASTAGVRLSVPEEVSFLTVGVFAASFQIPGYPEIVVVLLGLLALAAFEADGAFSSRQTAAFALALMAHEACAAIVFLPLAILFGRRSWLPFGGLLALYAATMVPNFPHHFAEAFHTQTMQGEISAQAYFLQSPRLAFISALFSFKVLWLLVPPGVFLLWKIAPARALFAVAGISAAAAAMYIAIDYSRVMAFATIPMLLCFLEARKRMPAKVFRAVIWLNIAAPSFYAGAYSGLIVFRGVYYQIYRHLLSLPPAGVQ